ncbi:MAG: cytochrome C [Acidobacteria bacterium]|nr:MAG: cytochrome C [Acidobacteriota bacterium]
MTGVMVALLASASCATPGREDDRDARDATAPALTPLEQLGKSVFFDQRLSVGGNQSCASCHAPTFGWTGDLPLVNAGSGVYEGSIKGEFGNRKPPTVAYAMAPVLHTILKNGETLFVGGSFWDGRATGKRLGDPIAEQAQGPFVNPVEQALPDTSCVVRRVCTATYDVSLEAQFPGSCSITWPADIDAVCALPGAALRLGPQDRAKSDRAYDHIAKAVAAYERSREVNPFSSKFDRHLSRTATLTVEEKLGLELFAGRGQCATCHVLDKGPDGRPPLFTDFTFDNIGVPRNPENSSYMAGGQNPSDAPWVDNGLGAFLVTRPEWRGLAKQNLGRHKVPTLRNVDLRPTEAAVKAYMHNGYFKTLSGIVHFYNTRDVKPVCSESLTERDAMARNCWPPPEVAANVNKDGLGHLGLSQTEENAIVTFLRALSDGYTPAAGQR